MKKLLCLFLLVLASTASYAKGSSHPQSTEPSSALVPYEQGMRVMYFHSGRISFAPGGRFLLCDTPNEPNWKYNSCVDKEGNNAWHYPEDINIPGYEIQYLDFKISGTPVLFMYFRKKTEK